MNQSIPASSSSKKNIANKPKFCDCQIFETSSFTFCCATCHEIHTFDCDRSMYDEEEAYELEEINCSPCYLIAKRLAAEAKSKN